MIKKYMINRIGYSKKKISVFIRNPPIEDLFLLLSLVNNYIHSSIKFKKVLIWMFILIKLKRLIIVDYGY